MEHERQHWLPEAYLSAWLDPDPKRQNPLRIHRYRPSGERWDYYPLSRSIFWVRDLYTVTSPDGHRDFETEHALRDLEDAYARIRDQTLCKQKPISDEARLKILVFIAALRLRSPASRDFYAGHDAAVLEVASVIESSLQKMSPEQKQALPRSISPKADRQEVPVEAFRRNVNRAFGETLPADILAEAEILNEMHLSILTVQTEGSTLITSDNPVVWWDPTDPPPSRRPLGLGRQNVEITVPFGPTMCASVTHRPGPVYASMGSRGVDEINLRTLYCCREFFLSEKPSLKVHWLDDHGQA